MNVAESAMPFTKTEGLSRDQKRLIIELLLKDDPRFSSYTADMFLESAALLNGGDDGQILPRVDGEPLDPTTWKLRPVVLRGLLEKYIACIGRSLSSYDELPLSKAPFHKRIMRVAYGTVILEAPLSTVIRRMVYPDKEKDDRDLSYQRPALLAAQLLNGYSNPDAWARCGDFAFRFLKNTGYDFNQLVACYIARRKRTADFQLPWMISWVQLRPICERLFGYSLPLAKWECELANELTIINRVSSPNGFIRNVGSWFFLTPQSIRQFLLKGLGSGDILPEYPEGQNSITLF